MSTDPRFDLPLLAGWSALELRVVSGRAVVLEALHGSRLREADKLDQCVRWAAPESINTAAIIATEA